MINAMMDYKLSDVDPGDIDDLLVKVEKSFDIRFERDELSHILTFGQLCDHIADKISLNNSNDCTSQQAFYKLREAISSTLLIAIKTISTNTSLSDILPRKTRRIKTKRLEAYLDHKLDILRPPHWVKGTLFALLLISIAGIYFNWQIALGALVFSIAGLWFTGRIGKELDLQTVGQVAEKMTREHYLKSRRDQTTFNKTEIEKVLRDLFSKDLGLDKSKLSREAEFVD